MYSFLNKSNIFCITYKVKKYCKFCEINKLNNDEVLYLDSLIKINKDNYKLNVEGIIDEILGIRNTRCPLCGYNEDKIINDIKYDKCLTIEAFEYNLPKYLSFIIDTEISTNSYENFNNYKTINIFGITFLKII